MTSGVEVFATTVGSSYSLTVAMGTSIWGVVGVLFFSWGERVVLVFFLLLLLLFVFSLTYVFFFCGVF